MKYLMGSVELTSSGDSIRFIGRAHVESGRLEEETLLADGKPQHEIWQVELPDGAIPFCIIPPLYEDDPDVLQWYMQLS